MKENLDTFKYQENKSSEVAGINSGLNVIGNDNNSKQNNTNGDISLKENKNVILIIDIFDRLCKEFSNIELLLIGSGNEKYESLVHQKHIYLQSYTVFQKMNQISADGLFLNQG